MPSSKLILFSALIQHRTNHIHNQTRIYPFNFDLQSKQNQKSYSVDLIKTSKLQEPRSAKIEIQNALFEWIRSDFHRSSKLSLDRNNDQNAET